MDHGKNNSPFSYCTHEIHFSKDINCKEPWSGKRVSFQCKCTSKHQNVCLNYLCAYYKQNFKRY